MIGERRMKNLLICLSLCCFYLQGIATLDNLSQWVASVSSYSSQLGSSASSAFQIMGASDVYPYYGGDSRSWAPASQLSSIEYIEFSVNTPVCVTSVATYETYSAGFVVKILAMNPSGTWDELWKGNATKIQSSQIFSPTLRNVSYKATNFRIYMDGSAAGTWIELDAVRVNGSQNCIVSFAAVVTPDPLSQWAASVTSFSSQLGSQAGFYSAAIRITGEPDVYPFYSNDGRAWAPASQQTSMEFIQFSINTPVCVTSVATYETYSAGFVVKILAMNPSGAWDELWNGNAAYIQSSRIFAPTLRNVSYTTKTFSIVMDGSVAGANWIELDAVRVNGSRSCACNRVVTLDTFSQWVSTVTSYSSQSGPTDYSANQIIGQPNFYPGYGYTTYAWAPLYQQSSSEFIQFDISTAVCVTSIATYETRHAGFVAQILARNSSGAWDELWSGAPTWIQSSRIFSPPLRSVSYTTKSFRINMVGSLAMGPVNTNYIELDAVRVDGSLNCTYCVSTLGTTTPLSPVQNLCSPNNQHKVILDKNGGIFIDGQQWLACDPSTSSPTLNYTTTHQLIIVVNGSSIKWQLDLPNNPDNGLPGNVTVTNDGLLQIVNALGVPLWNHKQGYLLTRLVSAIGPNFSSAPLILDGDNTTCIPDIGIIILRIFPTPRNTSILASVIGNNVTCTRTSLFKMLITGSNDFSSSPGKGCTVVSNNGTNGCTFLCTCPTDLCNTVLIMNRGCTGSTPICEVMLP